MSYPYPPEPTPPPDDAVPPVHYPPPTYAQPPYPQPGYPQPGDPQHGYPQAGYPQPGYPQPGYPYVYRPRETEGLAIASLVVSCAAVPGLCAYGIGGLLGVVGAIMGHVARRRIAANGTDGAGMALAGIIVGWITTAIVVVGIVLVIVLVVLSENDPNW